MAVAPDCGPTGAEPSPKSNLYVAIGVESPSLDPDASAVACSGAAPEVGFTLSAAEGGASPAVTVTCVVAVEEFPAVSATVTVAVYVPGKMYVWTAVGEACGPTAAEPSPKSNL